MTTFLICAGMRRSASTLQFNILRDILISDDQDLYNAGWIKHNDFDNVLGEVHAMRPDPKYVMLKSHAFLPDYSADLRPLMKEGHVKVFTVIRDIRDVMASITNWHKTKGKPWRQMISEDLPAIISETQSWINYCEEIQCPIFKESYEYMLAHDGMLSTVVMAMANSLDLDFGEHDERFFSIADQNSHKAVKDRVDNQEIEYDQQTGYWRGHLDSGEVGRYKNDLTNGQLSDILAVESARNYLIENGYTID